MQRVEFRLDRNSQPRFSGKAPEPRPGLSSGHIPNSTSLQFSLFTQTHEREDGVRYTTLKSPDAILQTLKETIGEKNVDTILSGQTSVGTTCGSGMTAAVLWLGLKLLGVPNIGLYDEVLFQLQ